MRPCRRRPKTPRKQQTYWWTQEIADLRKKVLITRKKAQRRKKRGNNDAKQAAHAAAKKDLVIAIKASKRRSWKTVCDDVDKDVRGQGYPIVTKRFRRQALVGPQSPERMLWIVETLFAEHPEREQAEIIEQEEIQGFNAKELQAAAGSMGKRKAPGPDGIPAEIINTIARETPSILLRMLNACLQTERFHEDGSSKGWCCWTRERAHPLPLRRTDHSVRC